MATDTMWMVAMLGGCPEAARAARGRTPEAAFAAASSEWRQWLAHRVYGHGNCSGYGNGGGNGDGCNASTVTIEHEGETWDVARVEALARELLAREDGGR